MQVKITLYEGDTEEILRNWAKSRFPNHNATVVSTYPRGSYEVLLTEKQEKPYGIQETFNPTETTLIHPPASESSTQDDGIPL